MRKALSRIGALVAFLGFMIVLGAVGGLDFNTLTWSQFWISIAHGVPMLIIGIRLTNLYPW